MTEREALKLALEAFGEIEWSNDSQWQSDRAAYAMLAIKEALAQPWEKFCDSNCVWTDHHPDCKLAEQEPVAWKTDDVELYVREDKFGFYNIPLYTHPPQRKPLTDEEIGNCIDEVNLTSEYGHHHFGWHKQFARAIEAAHGIKE